MIPLKQKEANQPKQKHYEICSDFEERADLRKLMFMQMFPLRGISVLGPHAPSLCAVMQCTWPGASLSAPDALPSRGVAEQDSTKLCKCAPLYSSRGAPVLSKRARPAGTTGAAGGGG